MKINLFDLPQEKFYVKLEDTFTETIINKIRDKYRSFRKFCAEASISEGSLHRWRRKQIYPLSIITKSCKLTNIPLKEIQRNIVELRSGGYPNGGYRSLPIFPKFPIELTKELARILAHLFGDGCITVNKRGHYNFQYYNQSNELREMFKNDAKQVFGDIKIHEAVNKNTPYVFLPAPVTIIMLQVVPTFNSKLSRLPDFIKNAPIDIKREFIKAFMDDEASVRFKPPYRCIELALSNKQFLNNIKDLLKEFKIKTSNIYEKIERDKYNVYYFYIIGQLNLHEFWEKIGFYHPEKTERLNKIIKFPGRNRYGNGETQELILKLLNNKPYSSLNLSKMLNRKQSTINFFLWKLKKDSKVKLLKYRNKSLWKVI